VVAGCEERAQIASAVGLNAEVVAALAAGAEQKRFLGGYEGPMRLLIVDDEKSLATLTADEFRWVDQSARNIESISLAGDLETAMHLLPEHNAILCDGQFPASPSTRSLGDEWRVVQREAEARGIVFILYSGGAATIEGARRGGIPAIFKPAKIERIYELLMENWLKVRPAMASTVPAR
jgi:hypothetical protein